MALIQTSNTNAGRISRPMPAGALNMISLYCPHCGKEWQQEGDSLQNPSQSRICDPCADYIRLTWQRMISLKGTEYQHFYFDQFKKTGNSKVVQACTDFSERKDDTYALLLFSRDPGNGKTHLATATLRNWITFNKPAIPWPPNWDNLPWHMTSDSAILRQAQRCFDDDCVEDLDHVINRYARYQFLVVDDLGKHTPRSLDFTRQVLYEIINIRWIKHAPTVFTSNKTGDELREYLGTPTYDRILGMTKHQILEVKGQSQR